MHSFNRKIIKSLDAENTVSEFKAKKITHEVPAEINKSNHFEAEFSGEAGSFRMDELLKQRTGLSERRQQEVMVEVESKVIEKLAEVEQDAYQKAYNLGMEEGKEEGLKLAEDRIHSKLAELDQVINSLQGLREEMYKLNEVGIVELAFKLGSRIAMREIKQDPAYIFDCVREVADGMQMDTEANLRVSLDDYDFIEEFKNRDLRNKELFSKIKLYKEENLQKGECIFDSNHGVVNATLENRIEKLWGRLVESFPKTELGPIVNETYEIPKRDVVNEVADTTDENLQAVAAEDTMGSEQEAQSPVDEIEQNTSDEENNED